MKSATTYNAPRFRPPFKGSNNKTAQGFWYVWHDGKQSKLTDLGAPRQDFKPKSKEYAALVVPAYLAWCAQQDAQAAQELMAAEANRGPLTVGQVCADYLQAVDNSPKSADYKREARRFLTDLCLGKDGRKGKGDLPALHFTTAVFQGWLSDHAGWKTTKTPTTPVIAAFNYAVENRKIEALPFGKIKPIFGQPRNDTFAEVELEVFRAAIANKHYRDFFDGCIATGCRPGELAKARKRHVAADCSAITLPPSDWKNGTKGRQPKPRTIYLTPAMQEAVKARIADLGDDDFLFTTRVGTPWAKKTWGQAFRAAKTASGVNPKLDPYATRHYYITAAIKKGLTYAQVAELCGTSEEEIRKHYNHVGDDRKYMLDLACRMAG